MGINKMGENLEFLRGELEKRKKGIMLPLGFFLAFPFLFSNATRTPRLYQFSSRLRSSIEIPLVRLMDDLWWNQDGSGAS